MPLIDPVDQIGNILVGHLRDQHDPAEYALQGEIDLSSARALSARLVEIAEATEGALAIDLAQVAFCDSSGLRVLLAASDELARAGRQLILRDPSPAVRRLLELSGMAAYVAVEPGVVP